MLGQRGRLGHADNVVPTEAGQALGRQLDAERAHHQGPDEGEQQAHRPGQVGVDKGQEVGVVGALDADEGGGVDDGQQGAQVEARLHGQGADADARHGEGQHQHREVVQVGQHQEQVQAGEDDRHQRPEEEPVDLRRRVVHRGEEAARHGGQDHRAAAVAPAKQDPQRGGDDDCADGGEHRVQHQPTIKKRRQPAQAPVPIDRAPGRQVFVADGVLQAAAVLPQVDPLGQAIECVGQQQRGAFIKGRGTRLQVFDLCTQH
ncbi:hypothetical protein D3C85_1209290 [compost metagenome]